MVEEPRESERSQMYSITGNPEKLKLRLSIKLVSLVKFLKVKKRKITEKLCIPHRAGS
jgi:hypothetical protein